MPSTIAAPASRAVSAGDALRCIRENLELTMRDVYRASVVIAARHRNLRLVIRPSILSEIETKGLTPNIYRVYSLSLIYNREMHELFRLYGLDRTSLRDLLRQPA